MRNSLIKMSVNKSVLILLICSLKSSLSHENSEIGFMSSVRHCSKKQPKVLAYCLLKQSILSMDRAIESNVTWQINDFLSLKKNVEWKPVELSPSSLSSVQSTATATTTATTTVAATTDTAEVRSNGNSDATTNGDNNIYNMFLRKATDLLRSRTIEFSIPQGDLNARSGRALQETGRKKKGGHKGGIMVSGFALVAMLAQMFLGKIAFLAAAALMLSKIALLFSTVNALKKQTSGSSGGEHVVYAEQPHGSSTSGWQRSFPKPITYDSHEFDYKGSYVDEPTLTSGSF